jgi:hypothetical protein
MTSQTLELHAVDKITATSEPPVTAVTPAAPAERAYVARTRIRTNKRSKRLAREWLYLLVSCIGAAGLWVPLRNAELPGNAAQLGPALLAPLVAAVYVAIGIVRLTVWAIKTVQEPD